MQSKHGLITHTQIIYNSIHDQTHQLLQQCFKMFWERQKQSKMLYPAEAEQKFK